MEVIGEPDSITQIRAGLLTNWIVDRSRFRIPERTFAATDLTHWLALELASDAIAAIGGPDRIDRTRTAVIVANTLVGEFSRAALLRLRLPFLQDALTCAIHKEHLSIEAAARLSNRFTAELSKHFPDPNEDSLAGGLANTIAGRIANHFDLRGGAYSVDGACASSLVALADGANLLVSEQADAVVVVAVDLSLDPFELVGFSRNGVLATNEMRVFDAGANGFWPGEGGACAILMRQADATERGLAILARVRGWGISSDGAGGLNRPSSEGQVAAYRRAYEMAGVNPADITYVEAHGTGTAVGDPIEIRALATLRDGARASLPIGSIKANIGHTKAAAGLAGLVKVVEALRHGLVPPHVSCVKPHAVFGEVGDRIRPALSCERIDDGKSALAGVSGFGFGGINAHIVIERVSLTAPAIALPRPPTSQDAELFVFSGPNADEVANSIAAFQGRASTLSIAEFADAAAHAAATMRHSSIRVAIVASHGLELADRLTRAKAALMNGETLVDPKGGIFVGRPSAPPRIGFLFTGQGAPSRPDGGVWRLRFPNAFAQVVRSPSVAQLNAVDTEIAQPSIVAASLAASNVLELLGVSAHIAAGHSLGEITALAWAGALDDEAALDLARKRGSIMARAVNSHRGGMLRLALPLHDAEELARETGTLVACRNGTTDTVLSGTADAITKAAVLCKERCIDASRLAVSHAFHSPQMQAAAGALAEALEAVSFTPVKRQVASTISGELLTPHSDLRRLLVAQVMAPVLFDVALKKLAAHSDYLLEVGPGHGLALLAQKGGNIAFSVDAFGDSLKPLLFSAGALFAAGVDIQLRALFEDRYVGAFDPGLLPSFIESPCGSHDAMNRVEQRPAAPFPIVDTTFDEMSHESDPLAATLSAIARETGLEVSKIGSDDRFLDGLHLNSFAVTRIVTIAARMLGIPVPSMPTEFANATPLQLAEALTELRMFGSDSRVADQRITGVRPWVRTYGMKWRTSCVRPKSRILIHWSSVTAGQPMPLSIARDDRAGLLIWIDHQFELEAAEELVSLVAESARAGVQHLALCHNNAPIAAFARSVAREGYFKSVRVIDCSGVDANDAHLGAALEVDVTGYYEIRLAHDGGIEEPIFAPIDPCSSPFAAISASDVVVIVGGGKGIAAECALHIGRCGAAIVLVGRSTIDDPDVAATLDRAEKNGIRCRYVCANVLKPESLSAGLAQVLEQYGPATTLIYTPATNEPKRLTALDPETVRRTLETKTTGLASTLAVVGPGLRRLITFGSIIGRLGLEGESHYALANAMQTAATEAWAVTADGRAALALEWSVWGGAGMGERLGTIERLSAQGVDAISVDNALEAFERLITSGATGAITVTSRFGPPPDLYLGSTELPMLRFVDVPKVHFPGVELVIETTLSRGRDVYLNDHVVSGHSILPAVMGLEAIAQVSSALSPLGPTRVISDLAINRALIVPASGAVRIRIAALRNESGTTEVHLFADEDGFATAFMQASFNTGDLNDFWSPRLERSSTAFPAEKLYGPLFFNGKCFQRVEQFETVTSRRVAASLRSDEPEKWFSSYEPSTFVLWDPATTDAALHALQVAIPHRRVIPVSADQIEINATVGHIKYVNAIEKKASGKTYKFDLVGHDATGRVAQRWTNVTFRAVERPDIGEVLAVAPALAGAYLERVAREAFGDYAIGVSLISDGSRSRQSRRHAAIAGFGLTGKVDRRADGRPVRTDGASLSISHHCDTTLAVVASVPVGCDIEQVDTSKQLDIEVIRLHSAIESCRKLGRKVSCASIQKLIPGTVARIDGVAVITIDLPLPSGPHVVSFSCVSAPGAAAPEHQSGFSEVVF